MLFLFLDKLFGILLLDIMRKILYLIIAIIFVISCNYKKQKVELKEEVDTNNILHFVFPDTVIVNISNNGEVIYDMALDSIKKNSVSNRFIFLYATSNKNAIDIESIKKAKHEIFIDTIGEGFFRFNITFDNIGNNTANLVFEDVIMIKSNGADKIPIYKTYTSISKPIFVKEK